MSGDGRKPLFIKVSLYLESIAVSVMYNSFIDGTIKSKTSILNVRDIRMRMNEKGILLQMVQINCLT